MQAVVQPFHLTEEQGEAFWFFGSLLTLKAPDGTGVSWMEQLVPAGGASPYHIHNDEDEMFYIIEGEMSFVSGDTAWKAAQGSYVFLPRGIPHGFRSETQSRSILATTSGEFAQFVRAMGDPALTRTIPEPGPIDFPKLLDLAARHGLQILGPLPDYTV